jgi:hypothetical protein
MEDEKKFCKNSERKRPLGRVTEDGDNVKTDTIKEINWRMNRVYI